jgi:hypothetical protein
MEATMQNDTAGAILGWVLDAATILAAAPAMCPTHAVQKVDGNCRVCLYVNVSQAAGLEVIPEPVVVAPAEPKFLGRNEAILAIRKALKARSGRTWSVRGGRGTAWGWIRIDTPPARTVCWPCADGRQDECTCARSRGAMPAADRETLKALLRLDRVHQQGISIPASSAYYREYVDRAEGREPAEIGTPYWD